MESKTATVASNLASVRCECGRPCSHHAHTQDITEEMLDRYHVVRRPPLNIPPWGKKGGYTFLWGVFVLCGAPSVLVFLALRAGIFEGRPPPNDSGFAMLCRLAVVLTIPVGYILTALVFIIREKLIPRLIANRSRAIAVSAPVPREPKSGALVSLENRIDKSSSKEN